MNGARRHGGAKSFKEYAMAQDYEIKVKVTGVDQATNQVDNLTDSFKEAGEQSSQLGALDKITGGAVTGFRNATAGVKSFITGLKLTRAAVIATGIGALVVGVTALVGAFLKTRKGARILKTVMAGLGGVMTTITNVAQGLGEFIFEAFNNPRETIKGLADDIQTFVISKVEQLMEGLGLLGTAIKQAFEGDFSKAANTAAEGLTKVVDAGLALNPVTAVAYQVAGAVAEIAVEATATVKAAVALEKRTQALTDAQRRLTVQRSKDRAEIKRLNMIAEDTTKSLEEREAAAQEAINIEKGLMAERQRIAKEELDIATEKAALSDSSEEDLQNLADLEAAYIDIRTESFEMQTTLNNKLNTIRNQAAAEAKAAADAIIKAEEAVTKALQEAALSREDAQTQEIEKERAKYQALQEKAGENMELVAQLKESERLALLDIDAKYDALELEAEKKKEDDAKKIRDAADAQRKKDTEAAEAAMAALKESATAGTFDLLTTLNKTFAKDTEEGQKKAFKRNQALSIAETLVSTYAAAQKAYASQLAIPSPDAPIRAQIAAGVAVAAGLAKVAAIKSQQFTGGASSGGAAGGGGAGGGGIQSVGVDVGTLVPNQQNPTPEPVRAYVVENEISNKQALNRELQIQTTL